MAQLPISAFLKARLVEYDPTFELRGGTGFEQLFFKPMEFIVQPLRDEANLSYTNQSLLRILLTGDVDNYDVTAVDALISNLFVTRREGGNSGGVARVYYNDPLDIEYPSGGAVFTGSNGLTYSNTAPFIITLAEMSSQVDTNGLYYFDIAVESDNTGADTILDSGGLVSLANDTNYVSVTNIEPLSGGLDTETNTEVITRTQNSIGVRDLVTGGGFNAILFDNFSATLVQAQPIGFGDPEMMRDIVYNTHIGGRVDGYAKTPSLHTGSKDFIGLLLDTTRQTFASTNVQMAGTGPVSLGNPNIDRTNAKIPIVMQIKPSVAAQYISTVNISSPIDLSSNQYIKIGIDGVFKNINIAGVNPSSTNRNEIVTLINAAFGYLVAFPSGNTFLIRSLTAGITSQVVISTPDSGTSALTAAFGLGSGGSPYIYNGSGPLTYIETQNYIVDDAGGNISRVIGPSVLSLQTTGQTNNNSNQFLDSTFGIFSSVAVNDIITITAGADAGDYRILSIPDANTLVLDGKLTATASSVNYLITRTGIKNNEIVYVQYWYNPLSIDIGNKVILDAYGNRGMRPGRENETITDLPLVRITMIEIIDAITLEPTGDILVGSNGYGYGGYGQGGYGDGAGADWYLVVNSPTERFSMFEDSYIVINSGLQALNFRVHYEYAPEISTYHDFVRGDYNRVLDGDILMKHYLPAYVNGEIKYSVNANNSSIPDNATVEATVKKFINKIASPKILTYSEIAQLITLTTDPSNTYTTEVFSFTLTATVHNTDGTTTLITGKDDLRVITPVPFPLKTNRPLSPRITHWIADNIILTRVPSV